MPSDHRLRKSIPSRTQPAGDHPLLRAFDAVQEAERLRLAGKVDRAERTCAAVLKEFPDYVAALQTMGLILADREQYERAMTHLHRATMHLPNDPNILTALSGVYLRLEANQMAIRTLEQARQLAPDDSNILVTLGEIYREEKEYELSNEAYRAALDIEPDFLPAEIGYTLNLVQIGQLDRAAEIIERRVREGSRSLHHLGTLSQLPASFVNFDLVALLDEARPEDGSLREDDYRAALGFAKASALDKAGRHEEAWAQLRLARQHDYEKNRKGYQDFRQRFAPLLELAQTAPRVSPRRDADLPVSLFISGPSRSGKTTLERLVGSLPGVKRGYENPIVENSVRLAFKTAGFPTRDHLAELPPRMGELFRTHYIEELKKRAGANKVLTNTVPARIDDALRVVEEIPNARFIFVKRDTDDLMIRIYMRNYKSGNYYAADLRDIREYVTWSHRMIDEMAGRMPESSRVLTYEELVTDPDAALALAADLCGLDKPAAPAPPTGDDRGCAAPYRRFIEEALQSADV